MCLNDYKRATKGSKNWIIPIFFAEFHDQQTNGFGLTLVFSLPMAINGPKEVT